MIKLVNWSAISSSIPNTVQFNHNISKLTHPLINQCYGQFPTFPLPFTYVLSDFGFMPLRFFKSGNPIEIAIDIFRQEVPGFPTVPIS